MPAILLAFGSLLISLLRTYLPGIVGRLLLALGLTLAATKVALPALQSFVQGKMGGLPSVVLAHAGATGFDIAVTMILSTVIAVRGQRVLLSKINASP